MPCDNSWNLPPRDCGYALCPLCQPLSPTASCSLGSWDCSLLLLFLSEYSCFTMLCWCLQYNKLNQLYVCIYPRPFEPPSHPSSHPSKSSEDWAEVPVLHSSVLPTILHMVVYLGQHQPPSSSHPSPHCVQPSILYICISNPALQKGSTAPFF